MTMLSDVFPQREPADGFHSCEGTTRSRAYGEAIDGCFESKDGTLWAGNCEYESQVAFCPYCGFKAKVAPVVEEPK